MSKIISHLKENWIKNVFETIVVVTDVFGAFLLNNWNEQNKLKKQAVEVPEELVDEFKINRVEVNKFIA